MAVNKVVYNGAALVDLTGDTVTADALQSGYTAHQADGERITGNAVPAINPNILDNWYFADPVNQRGQTEYTAAGYAIDRWRISNGSLTLDSSGAVAKVQNTDHSSSRNCFYQLIEKPRNYIGKEITFSVLYKGLDGTIYATAYLNGGGPNVTGNPCSLSDGIVSVTTAIPENITPSEFRVHALVSPGGSFTPIAAKLELGSRQTLAHKEGEVWVLNDPPPNKVLELAKCQRYFYKTSSTSRWTRTSHIAANQIYFDFRLNTPMRSNPAILEGSGIQVENVVSPNSTLISGFTFSAIAQDSGIRIVASKQNHGLSDASINTAYFMLSAEL